MTFMEAYDNKGRQVRIVGYKPPKVGKLLYLSRIGGCWYGRLEMPNGETTDRRLRSLRLVEEKS